MKRARLAIGVSVLAAVSFTGGLMAGNRWTFGWLNDVLQREVQGNLSSLIEVVSYLRVGEIDRATGLMELRIAAAVASLPQGRKWEQIPKDDRTLLVIAKKYLTAFPPAKPPEALLQVLSWIPDEELDLESCSPAVRQLLAEG